MNYKFLFPTFLNRFLFVQSTLNDFRKNSPQLILHVGAGEGDYDPMLSTFSSKLVSIDNNEDDLHFAKNRNKNLLNVEYNLEDILSLSFYDNSFDVVIAIEVIEHISNPAQMMENIFKVLKPSGIAIFTFPNEEFPITYDPINRILSWFSKKRLPIGAYAFEHDHLISSKEFKKYAVGCGFHILKEEPLSGYFIGLTEAYWTGLFQRIFKTNFSNKPFENRAKIFATRPGNKVPKLSLLTQKLIIFDKFLSKKTKKSIGMGYVLQKK